MIERSIPGEAVHLTDLTGDTSYWIYETQATNTLKEGRVIIGRIVPFLRGWMFTSESLISFSGNARERLRNTYGVTTPQLTFMQRYYRNRKLQQGV